MFSVMVLPMTIILVIVRCLVNEKARFAIERSRKGEPKRRYNVISEINEATTYRFDNRIRTTWPIEDKYG